MTRPGFELATFGSTQNLNSQNPLSHGRADFFLTFGETNNNTISIENFRPLSIYVFRDMRGGGVGAKFSIVRLLTRIRLHM